MITCYHYHSIIKRSLDADGKLPEHARNHIQKCSDCRKVYESETKIVRGLLNATGDLEQSPSPFLHAKIMSAIVRADGIEECEPIPGRSIWAIGLTAACLLLLGIVLLRQHAVNPSASVAHNEPPNPAPIELSLGMKLPDGNQLRQWTGKLDEPLEHEMKLVVGDAKTAINSLAENFLPEKLRLLLFEEEKGS